MTLEEKQIRRGRHLARTDLFFLAYHILGYDKIIRRVHQPVIDHLMQFGDVQGRDEVDLENGIFKYTPLDDDPANVLPNGPKDRRRLVLDPRSWFKTTINCIAHTIQILLNFPETTINVVHAKQEFVEQEIMSRIQHAFTANEKMRLYFPEFCAPFNPRTGRPEKIGTQAYFYLPNRRVKAGTPSVVGTSIEAAAAGRHFHWIKFTDIVTEETALSRDQMNKITKRFIIYDNILIGPNYFVDVEGTCYDFADTYNDHIMERAKEQYSIFVRGCFLKEPPEGVEETFQPDERDWPYQLEPCENCDGKDTHCFVCHGKGKQPISRFPENFTTRQLMLKKEEDEWIFACQQLNNPIAADSENRTFPVKKMSWIGENELKHVNFVRFTMRVDLAEKITERSDFTAVTIVGWDRFGRAYLVDAVQGKFLPETSVDLIFTMYHKWKCAELGIEESSFMRGLYPTIKRVIDLDTSKWMNIKFIKRDNSVSKPERIQSLQPWYTGGTLRFSSGINQYVREQLQKQFSQFPANKNDDLLDSLADHFQGKQFFGAAKPRKTTKQVMDQAFDVMLRTKSIEEFRDAMGFQSAGDGYWERLGVQ